MTLKYDWSAMGSLAESITAGRLTVEIETAFPQLDAVNYPAKRDGALAEVARCVDLGTRKYTWTDLGQHEDAITLGRLTTEIHAFMPELDVLSYPLRRDAALTELIACLGCSPVETWANYGSAEDPIVSGKLAADIRLTIPGLTTLSYPAARDAALAELIAADPCNAVPVVDPPPSFPTATMVLWLEADYGVTTKDLLFLAKVI